MINILHALNIDIVVFLEVETKCISNLTFEELSDICILTLILLDTAVNFKFQKVEAQS